MQSFKQLKDSLKHLSKLEQKEILNKKRLELKQSRKKRKKRQNLRYKLRKIENIIKEIDDFSLFDKIPLSNFTFVKSKYWKSKKNYKMSSVYPFNNLTHLYFKIYLPNFFNKTRQREALNLFLLKNKENIKNEFQEKIESYKQELLTINKQQHEQHYN